MKIGLAAEWFVASEGSDANSGTEAEPFATLERSRDAVRMVREAAHQAGTPVVRTTIWLKGGTYSLQKTFELGVADSGSKGAEIVYRAVKGAKVRIVGGRRLTEWEKISDPAILERLGKGSRVRRIKQDKGSPI